MSRPVDASQYLDQGRFAGAVLTHKAVASLGNFPYYLLSNNPQVKTIADLTEKDRIAVPAVGVSVQSRFLQ